jgi:hypothetical protein
MLNSLTFQCPGKLKSKPNISLEVNPELKRVRWTKPVFRSKKNIMHVYLTGGEKTRWIPTIEKNKAEKSDQRTG